MPGYEWYVELQLYEPELTWGLFQVPVIAVFTKYDQFRRDIVMEFEDEDRDPGTVLDSDVHSRFTERYLANFTNDPPFICLESEDYCRRADMRSANSVPKTCTNLANVALV
jgi:hypothetical protein